MTPTQCRLARTALEWNARDLAEQSGVGVSTIHRFETSERSANQRTIERLQSAFSQAGIEFTPEDHEYVAGVRLRKAVTLAPGITRLGKVR